MIRTDGSVQSKRRSVQMHAEQQEIPAQLYTNGGGDYEPVNMDAYLSKNGMITVSLTEETWVQMSPLVAKQFVERLRGAIGEALVEMLDQGHEWKQQGADSLY
ncbi:MAG: hypothetical protein HKL98_03570 [Burkholderiales bacterium]|nr:hypothetical protein [Burkholderiales bacterium]